MTAPYRDPAAGRAAVIADRRRELAAVQARLGDLRARERRAARRWGEARALWRRAQPFRVFRTAFLYAFFGSTLVLGGLLVLIHLLR